MSDPDPKRVARLIASSCVALRVRRLGRVVTRIYDGALAPHGINIAQLNLLAAVSIAAGARQVDLGRILDVEKSTLSREVELMKRDGWLKSEPPTGGRNQTIRVSPEGLKLLGKAQPSWQEAQAEAKLLIGDDGEAALRQMAPRLGFGKPAS